MRNIKIIRLFFYYCCYHINGEINIYNNPSLAFATVVEFVYCVVPIIGRFSRRLRAVAALCHRETAAYVCSASDIHRNDCIGCSASTAAATTTRLSSPLTLVTHSPCPCQPWLGMTIFISPQKSDSEVLTCATLQQRRRIFGQRSFFLLCP